MIDQCINGHILNCCLMEEMPRTCWDFPLNSDEITHSASPKPVLLTFFSRECSVAHASKWHENAVPYYSRTLSRGRRKICIREIAYWINYNFPDIALHMNVLFSINWSLFLVLCENSMALFKEKKILKLFFFSCKIAVFKM